VTVYGVPDAVTVVERRTFDAFQRKCGCPGYGTGSVVVDRVPRLTRTSPRLSNA